MNFRESKASAMKEPLPVTDNGTISSSDTLLYNSTELIENPWRLKSIFNIIETERVKIGHELHDSVNPLLAVAKLYMDILRAVTRREKMAKTQAISSILTAIQNIRQISYGLVISQNEELDLIQMISKLVKKIELTEVFKISFSVRQKKQLEALCNHQKLNLYRIIQEQLNNAIKYSKADLVKITLGCRKAAIKLSIHDNGVGFDSSKTANGIGLTNIQKRSKGLNGFATIKSSPDNGCHLNVSFPVR